MSKYDLSADNFGAQNPQLVAEWSSKNNSSVFEVPKNETNNYVWVCSVCKSEFEASPAERNGKTPGCTACKRTIAWDKRRKKMLDNGNSLVNLFPQISNEIDISKHPNLDVNALLPSTNIRLWWRCASCGHQWSATINTRTSASGSGKCPACSRYDQDRKREETARKKRGSILELFPDLVAELHPTKNGNLSADLISSTHTKKIWWRCRSCGQDFSVSPYRRTREKIGCKTCSFAAMGKRYQANAAKKSGSFLEHYPALKTEWHPTKNEALNPYALSPSSNLLVFWKCKYGHEWQETINRRTARGASCPDCNISGTSRAEIRIYSELKFIFKDAEWRQKLHNSEVDIYIPSVRIAVEYDGVFWHANKTAKDRKKGDVLSRNGITLYRIREKGLQSLSERDVLQSEGDDELILLKQLLTKILSEVSLSEEVKANTLSYLKEPGYKSEALYQEITSRLPAPPLAESLAALRPDLASEWHPTKNGQLRPEHFAPRAGYKVWWLCSSCSHEFQQTIDHRNGRNTGCNLCGVAKAALSRKENKKNSSSLASDRPDLLSLYDSSRNAIKATSLSPKSSVKVDWACGNCDSKWSASPKQMQARKNPCKCSKGM